MDYASRLRLRISLLLAAAGALGSASLTACGGKVILDSGATGSGGSGVGGAGGGVTTATGVGGGPPACDSGDPTVDCFGPPASGVAPDGCSGPQGIEDGCCNPAIALAPPQNGQCCYYFCVTACCGRPFTVEGRARVAGACERDGWAAPAGRDDVADLPAAARAALVDAWIADASMEHASVASFARFTLELLALGAPADLVEASQRASLDEIEHARLCFGVASRLGGKALGPAALDLAGALRPVSLAESAAAAVREGCIGETVAALTARAQLDRAGDEGVRRALARIAEDEEAHAALAWRFVAWAIAAGGDDVRLAVARAFEAGTCRLRAERAPRDGEPIADAILHRFGRLTADETDEVTRAALADVIAPCAAMLARHQHVLVPAPTRVCT
jgi:hypothetical protein